MNQVFDFDGSAVRTIVAADGEPWWIAKDICHALGYANTSKAISRLEDYEKGLTDGDTVTQRGITNGYTPEQEGGTEDPNLFGNSLLCINESGIFSLILTSRKPHARRFKKWVTSEVLPAIRRQGFYDPAAHSPHPAAATPIQSPPSQAELQKMYPKAAHAAGHTLTHSYFTDCPNSQLAREMIQIAVIEASRVMSEMLAEHLSKVQVTVRPNYEVKFGGEG